MIKEIKLYFLKGWCGGPLSLGYIQAKINKEFLQNSESSKTESWYTASGTQRLLSLLKW